METLEDLKAIIANAPEGAVSIFGGTYLDSDNRFYAIGCWFGVSGYIETKQPTRSLSDIERIIELMECLKSIEQTIEGGDVLGCWDMMKIKDCLND